MPKLLTVAEVAHFFRLSKATIWRMCRAGKLPAVKIGARWLIKRDELMKMVGPDRGTAEGG